MREFIAFFRALFRRRKYVISNVDSSTNFYSFFKQSPCPMWIIDAVTLRFLAVNRQVLKKYGYSKKEFLSMHLQDVRVLGEIINNQNVHQVVKEQDSNGFFSVGNSLHRNKKGDIFCMQIYVQPIKFNGKDARLTFLINDDARVKAEAEIKLQNEALKEIAWVQSHQVRSHVATILGLTHLIGEVSEKEEIMTILNGIRSQAEELDKIIKVINDKTTRAGFQRR